jgi:hypothetical protein
MEIERLNEIIAAAREAKCYRLKLDRLHKQQLTRMQTGRMTRATTTTYNAAAAHAAEGARFHEARLRALIAGVPEKPSSSAG